MGAVTAPITPTSQSTTPGTLVLLRHGESEWNKANLFTGWVDVPLSENGRAEAARGGTLLAENDLLPDVVHTSVLLRAIQLGLAQLLRVDPVAVAGWLAAGVLCSVAVVAAVRWGAARRVRSPWLLIGLLPPVLYEIWLLEPVVAG